ncbi:hypothetical protein vseg_011430 [Gypsophila vaccaria]
MNNRLNDKVDVQPGYRFTLIHYCSFYTSFQPVVSYVVGEAESSVASAADKRTENAHLGSGGKLVKVVLSQSTSSALEANSLKTDSFSRLLTPRVKLQNFQQTCTS